jgi:hypothetical protein
LPASTCSLPLPACSSFKLDGSQQEEEDDASEEAFEECAEEDQKAGPAKKYRVSERAGRRGCAVPRCAELAVQGEWVYGCMPPQHVM